MFYKSNNKILSLISCSFSMPNYKISNMVVGRILDWEMYFFGWCGCSGWIVSMGRSWWRPQCQQLLTLRWSFSKFSLILSLPFILVKNFWWWVAVWVHFHHVRSSSDRLWPSPSLKRLVSPISFRSSSSVGSPLAFVWSRDWSCICTWGKRFDCF